MGRYPLVACARKYLEIVGPALADATVKELDRRYRRMGKDFAALKAAGKIDTDNPAKMGEKDVLAYVGLLRARGVKESGIAHNLSSLSALLLHFGNTTVQRLRREHSRMIPKRHAKRQDPIGGDIASRIFRAAEGVRDWRRLEAHALVIMALSTGLRPKELRLAAIGDLDLGRWILNAEHVKGEGAYGQPREVPIRPEGRKTIERYVRVRNAIVAKTAPLNDALFPAIRDKGDGYFAPNSLGQLKRLVEDEIGARFELRACRRTFGQGCIDEGLSVEAVSLLLGHATTKTTESYYCRKRPDAAIKEAEALWSASRPPGAKTPEIEFRKWLPGYG